jgi:uncharacterized membrane protein
MQAQLQEKLRHIAARGSLGLVAALTLLTATGPAFADTCGALRRQREKISDQLTELRVEYPFVVAAVEGCVAAANSQPKAEQDAALLACLGLVCLGAGEDTCTSVSQAIFDLTLKKLRHDMLYRQNRCDRAAATGQVAAYSILVDNQCSHPISVAVRYSDAGGVWRSAGWWKLGSNARTYLADTNGIRLTTAGATMYFYAETTDDAELSWQGDYRAAMGGSNLPMRRVDDASGDTEVVLTCN